MPRLRLALLCGLTLCAFAANSLLTRRALGGGLAGAAGFAALRLLSGAAMLWLLARRRPAAGPGGGWKSAPALLLYAPAFSWAYPRPSASVRPLLLLGAGQGTLIRAAVAHRA